MKECVICGKEVSGRGRTCSNSCRGKLSNMDKGKGRKLITKNCIICGKKFELRPDRIDELKTCSKECSKENRSNIMSGENNHQYNKRGEMNSSWKGGRVVTDKGYIKVLNPEHPNSSTDGYVLEHIMVMSKSIGRPLDTKSEVVHHVNGIKDDNRIENLEIMSYEEHSRLHRLMEEPRGRDVNGRFTQIGDR